MTRQPLLSTDPHISSDDAWVPRVRNLREHAALPLVVRDHILGVLLVDNPESERLLGEDDLHVLGNVATQTSSALRPMYLRSDGQEA